MTKPTPSTHENKNKFVFPISLLLPPTIPHMHNWQKSHAARAGLANFSYNHYQVLMGNGGVHRTGRNDLKQPKYGSIFLKMQMMQWKQKHKGIAEIMREIKITKKIIILFKKNNFTKKTVKMLQ